MILAPHLLSLPLRSLISIVASGEGGGGRQNLTKKMAPPLSVIRIVKCCGVWGGGALRGAKILQKIMAPLLSVIKIVKYCGVMGGGGGHWGAPKSYKNNSVPHLCH